MSELGVHGHRHIVARAGRQYPFNECRCHQAFVVIFDDDHVGFGLAIEHPSQDLKALLDQVTGDIFRGFFVHTDHMTFPVNHARFHRGGSRGVKDQMWGAHRGQQSSQVSAWLVVANHADDIDLCAQMGEVLHHISSPSNALLPACDFNHGHRGFRTHALDASPHVRIHHHISDHAHAWLGPGELVQWRE